MLMMLFVDYIVREQRIHIKLPLIWLDEKITWMGSQLSIVLYSNASVHKILSAIYDKAK